MGRETKISHGFRIMLNIVRGQLAGQWRAISIHCAMQKHAIEFGGIRLHQFDNQFVGAFERRLEIGIESLRLRLQKVDRPKQTNGCIRI